jgi:hypothetical protein
MEQQSFYDFISEKSDKLALGLNGTNLWNSLSVTEQQMIGNVKVFLCPSRRSSAGSYIGKTDAGDGTQVYGTQGDYAIAIGRSTTNWANWLTGISQQNNVENMTAQRGPFRATIWGGGNIRNWKCRDDMGWLSDGTSNQIFIGEKLLYPSSIGECKNADSANRPYVGDCSILAAGEWKSIPIARSFNAHFYNGNQDKFDGSGNLEQTANESNNHWGSSHPGICNFLLGDGSVRSLSVTIPTGALADNANSILAKLGNVGDGNTVTIP